MKEKAATPLRATILVLLSAGALAAGGVFGVRFGHPIVGVLSGYLSYLGLAARAFRAALPGADDVLRPSRSGGPFAALAAIALGAFRSF